MNGMVGIINFQMVFIISTNSKNKKIMILREFLKEVHQDIALLYFDENEEVECKLYEKRKLRSIPNDLQDKEVMETKQEDDCLEIWI